MFIDMQCKVAISVFTTQVYSDVPQCNLPRAARNMFSFLLILIIVYLDFFFLLLLSGFLFFVFLWNPPSHPGTSIHPHIVCTHAPAAPPRPPWLHWIITHTLRSYSLGDQMRNAKRGVKWKVRSSVEQLNKGCKPCE